MKQQSFTDLIRQGEKERERGNIKESIALFLSAIRIANSHSDRSMANAHIGLSYFKDEKWDKAKDYFDRAIYYAHKDNNQNRLLEAQRHMSMWLLQKGKKAQAMEEATNAWLGAKERGRNDLPWFTHARVKIALQMDISKKKKWEWIWTEIQDLRAVWGKEKNRVAKVQWLKGLMKAIVQVTFS